MLTWLVTLPGQTPLTITYTNFSSSGVFDDLGTNVSSILTDNLMGSFLESVLELTVIQNVSMNGTIIACSSEALDNEMAIAYVNTSGMHITSTLCKIKFSSVYFIVPLTPFRFSIAEVYYTDMNVTITFEWYEPQGRGPEAIVDDYIITVAPNPVSPSSIITIRSSPLNVTLNYNYVYTATIIAVNCAGESEAFALSDIEYG